MRIAVNTRFLLAGQLEGFGWYTHEIMRRMIAKHPEDEFIFIFDRPYDTRFVYGNNVQPVVLYPPARHPLLFHIWFEWMIPLALRYYKADVFFSPDSMCSLRSKIPAVMTCHDLVPLHFPEQIERRHRNYLLRGIPKWLARANKVLTVSEFVGEDIRNTCNLPSEKVIPVYNACRDGFLPLSEPEKQAVRDRFSGGKSYFFYAGAIHPRKNVHRLIRAFDLFKQNSGASIQLLLAGRFAWQTGEVRSAWEQAAFKNDIVFLGYIGEEDLPRVTASAHASVFVSLSEGFGLPLVEAMACEIPILTSTTSCLPEIAGEAALLVDPFSEQAIADGLYKLYSDEELRQQLIRNGRTRRLKFSWDLAAQKVYDTIKAVAEGR